MLSYSEMLYLEGHEDLLNRLIMEITGDIVRLIGVSNLLTKSHDPPSSPQHIDKEIIS